MPGSLNDYMYQYFASATANGLGAMPVVSASPGLEQSIRGYGTAAAPAAAANFAAVTLPNAGLYTVRIETFIGGTTVSAVEAVNMQFKINGTASLNDTLLNSVTGTTGSASVEVHEFLKLATPGDVLRVGAVAAATAGSIYYATIFATRVA